MRRSVRDLNAWQERRPRRAEFLRAESEARQLAELEGMFTPRIDPRSRRIATGTALGVGDDVGNIAADVGDAERGCDSSTRTRTRSGRRSHVPSRRTRGRRVPIRRARTSARWRARPRGRSALMGRGDGAFVPSPPDRGARSRRRRTGSRRNVARSRSKTTPTTKSSRGEPRPRDPSRRPRARASASPSPPRPRPWRAPGVGGPRPRFTVVVRARRAWTVRRSVATRLATLETEPSTSTARARVSSVLGVRRRASRVRAEDHRQGARARRAGDSGGALGLARRRAGADFRRLEGRCGDDDGETGVGRGRIRGRQAPDDAKVGIRAAPGGDAPRSRWSSGRTPRSSAAREKDRATASATDWSRARRRR